MLQNFWKKYDSAALTTKSRVSFLFEIFFLDLFLKTTEVEAETYRADITKSQGENNL